MLQNSAEVYTYLLRNFLKTCISSDGKQHCICFYSRVHNMRYYFVYGAIRLKLGHCPNNNNKKVYKFRNFEVS